MTSNVLLVFGQGGHAVQMRRLVGHLALTADDCDAIVDEAHLADGLARREWVATPLRPKIGFSLMGPMHFASGVLQAWHLIGRTPYQLVVSTGPGIAIAVALAARLRGVPVVHIETWSRFRSRSWAGRALYLLATRFYVQNRSLLPLYRRAKYSGRL
jgi:beta-1,4-N-acetylglucosaminyltransferase